MKYYIEFEIPPKRITETQRLLLEKYGIKTNASQIDAWLQSRARKLMKTSNLLTVPSQVAFYYFAEKNPGKEV